MKNIIGLSVSTLLFFIICIGGLITYYNSNNYLEKLTTTELSKKVENKESFILYVKNHTRNDSKAFTKSLIAVITEYKVKTYYIDIADLKDDKFNIVYNVVDFDKTPTIAFINAGYETDNANRIVGYKTDKNTYDVVLAKLKSNNYIK